MDYLKLVKTFLDANPNEVLTLLFTNPEGLSVGTVWKPVFDAAGLPFPPLLHLSLLNMTNMSGITPMAYVPPSIPVKQSEWPTLGQLIDSGRRVIVFLDSSTDTSAVNFILPEFQMVRDSLHSHHYALPPTPTIFIYSLRSGKHHSASQTPRSRAKSIESTVLSLQKITHI